MGFRSKHHEPSAQMGMLKRPRKQFYSISPIRLGFSISTFVSLQSCSPTNMRGTQCSWRPWCWRSKMTIYSHILHHSFHQPPNSATTLWIALLSMLRSCDVRRASRCVPSQYVPLVPEIYPQITALVSYSSWIVFSIDPTNGASPLCCGPLPIKQAWWCACAGIAGIVCACVFINLSCT